MIKAASALLEGAATEMQDYFDQRTDTWQESQVGESLLEMLESVARCLGELGGYPHSTNLATQNAGIT